MAKALVDDFMRCNNMLSLNESISNFLNAPCTIWTKKGDSFSTWRAWFKDAILTLLNEGEGFSGKRPNCDSGWQQRLAAALSTIDPTIVHSWEEEEGCKVPYSINWTKYSEICKLVIDQLILDVQYEEHNCFLDKIDGEIGYVTIKTKDEELWGEISATELAEKGIRERRRFKMHSFSCIDLEAIPDKEISSEECKRICQEIEDLLGDGDKPQNDY